MTRGRRSFARIRARLHRGERGFTMIEVIVAILIFGILITSVATTQSSSLNLIRTDRHRSVAANLASEEMDTIRSTDFTDLVVGRVEGTRDIDGVVYNVTRDSEWVLGDAQSGACDAPADAEPRYLRVDVSVTWPVMSGVAPVTSNTIVTPPVGTYDEITGHIGVKVVDRDAAPVSGVTVTLAGPQTGSQTTTADGCAFFAFLPAGAYTASVSASGYVSDQGVATPVQPASVAVGTTTSLLFQYDRAATLDLTLIGKDLGAPAPTDVWVTLANSHMLPTGFEAFPGSGSPRQITQLFPFVDGYEVWAGTCADAYSGDPPLAVQPASVTAATILLPEVQVTVLQDLGGGTFAPVPSLPVQAVHVADGSCAAGESFSLGVTDAAGQLAFALPWGTWDVQVGGFPNSVTLDPSSAPADGDGTWPYDVRMFS
jgi:prepilin-type N-terminal cleavage/methylation domain-containing protein